MQLYIWRLGLILGAGCLVIVAIAAGLIAGPIIACCWLEQETKKAWFSL